MNRFQALRNARITVLAILVLGTFVGLRSAAAPQGNDASKANTTANAENGKRLFRTVGCWECHGLVGQGGEAGPRIGPPRLELTALLAYVRHPKGQMPPYGPKAISDSDLTDIYAFLQSVPKPPDPKNVPLLNNLN